ncbi:cell division protein SepF [Propionibacteriaceae bacterium G1746]|uniref:cell division protein SepF n=1 Tax=Aestuariimicrobium sp. G57 TaxID=3418485 RepID=UPI003C1CAE87
MSAIRKAAAWFGLVADDRYASDPVDDEYTEQVYDEDEPSTVTPIHRSRKQGHEHEAPTPAVRTRPRAVEHRAGEHRPVEHIEEEPVEVDEPAAHAPVAQTPITADLSRIITVHPRTYNEARIIGEHFRDGVPVIMNLTEMDDADAKRLVDFGAGLIFGLRGSIERVTSRVFLLSPPNVKVTAEDKQRIASGGFFNQS